MKCENCGKKEATVKYTQNINGKYSKIQVCDECARKLGLDKFEMNMPIDFSSFLGEMFGDYTGFGLLPEFGISTQEKCENCGLTYDEFMRTGKLGCANCYTAFKDRLEPVLKNLHGSNNHIGRKAINNGEKSKKEKIIKKENNKLIKLQDDLKKAIQDERYEDAAKIRDEIKKQEKE